MASTAVTIPAFGAVENQLRTLCLHEFPCGTGSWREFEAAFTQVRPTRKRCSRLKPLQQKKTKLDPDSLESIKLEAQKENSEALQDLVSSLLSPWHLDYSWSEEAKELREIAVKSPWLIDRKFVLGYFKSLRIVDKNVSEVDINLVNLRNLKELTLSANFITNVNSKNMPSSLRVLELCANQISDISGLCVRPPLLDHLGLGYNKISFIGDHITGEYWPNLLSLDISHNDLCDLMDIIRKLTSLPKLRNLVLQGNPLSLIPSYRGYTIDTLRRLTMMDDIHITADEKHRFKGLARRREFIVDEARVQISVTYIKGLPCPEEIKNPDGQPELPVVERSYFVQFLFPEELKTKDGGDMLVVLTTDLNCLKVQRGIMDCPEVITVDWTPGRVLSPHTDQGKVDVQTSGQSHTQMVDSRRQESAVFPRANPNSLDPDVKPDWEGEEGAPASEDQSEPPARVKLVPVNSDPQPWSEEQELNWTVDLTRDDLLALRDFFRQGMDFTVVEQVVLGYPSESDTAPSLEREDHAKDGKGDKKKPDAPTKGKNSSKDKKKKKEPGVELTKSPPTFTTIAAFHIALENFLYGEFEYRNIFTKGDVLPPSTIYSVDHHEDKKLEKKDSKDKKKLNRGADKNKDSNTNAKKSPRTKESDKKSGKGGKHAEEGDDEDLTPPPLELEVTVKLHHWVMAMESVLEEEEKKNKCLQEDGRIAQ